MCARLTPPTSLTLGHLPYEGEAQQLRLPFVGELPRQGLRGYHSPRNSLTQRSYAATGSAAAVMGRPTTM